MTRQQAIDRANEMGGGASARPYKMDGLGEYLEWGVTDCNNLVVPPFGSDKWRTYQLRFMEVV